MSWGAKIFIVSDTLIIRELYQEWEQDMLIGTGS